MSFVEVPSGGDIVRGLVGAVSVTVVLALLSEPSVALFVPKFLFSTFVSVLCVATARSKRGVLLGIGAVILLRLIIGISLRRYPL